MKIVLFIIVLLFTSYTGFSQIIQPSELKTGDSPVFKNRAETEKWLVRNNIHALGIGYIKDGKIQQATVYGRNEKGDPYPDNTLFNVASLTKPVTALVVLKLVDNGQWSLDEPIYKYFHILR